MDFTTILIGFAVLLVGAILVMGITHYVINARKPVIDQRATIVSKRQQTSGGGNTPVTTTHYMTFEREGGSRVEYAISETDYGLLVVGDTGMLRSQGVWYKGFVRKIARVAI